MQKNNQSGQPVPDKTCSSWRMLLYRILSGFVVILFVGFLMFALLFAFMYFI